MKWSTLSKWQKVSVAIVSIGTAVLFLVRMIAVPVIMWERTQSSISMLSNRVDEISYKQDVIIEMLQPGGKKLATSSKRHLD